MEFGFRVIDKRTGREPIFDGNHIFRESWCKGRLIEFDIDGWYISEDGTLSLVDDCCNMAYPPPDRYDVVFENENAERHTGKWERHYIRPNVYKDLLWYCSACGNGCGYDNAFMFDYCPYCGAKMERNET